MPFRNPEYFKMIAETGSISGAAQALFITQPALSSYLNKLEAELGVTLFDRSKQPIEITHAGKLYLEYITRYEGMMSQMDFDLKTAAGMTSDSLRTLI